MVTAIKHNHSIIVHLQAQILCISSWYFSLQAPVAPAVSLLGSMVGDAFALAVVGYGIAISLGRIFALKYAYKVDSNQVIDFKCL